MNIEDKSDLLYGLEAIAKYLGLSRRSAKYRAEQKQIPTFKMGRHVCATKTAIAASFQRDAEGGRT